MIARPRRAKRFDRLAEELELRGLGTHRAADRCSNTMNQLSPRQREKVGDHLLSRSVFGLRAPTLYPRRLRLDLNNLEQFRPALQQRLDGGRVSDAYAKR